MKMSIFSYLKSVMQGDSVDSSKSFALVISVITGSMLCSCICFVMVYDVITNGFLKTDINDLGVFLLCIGGYVAGGGVNKALTENISGKIRKKKTCKTTTKDAVNSSGIGENK